MWPTIPERDTYLMLDDFGRRLGCAWRETDAESADRATLIRDLLDGADDDGEPIFDNTLNRALRTMSYDTGGAPGGDHCAPSFRSTGSTLLNEEGAFDSDVMKAQLVRNAERENSGLSQ